MQFRATSALVVFVSMFGLATTSSAAPPPCHSISGFVYLDANNNGLRLGPPTEPGIPASSIELRNALNVVVGSQTTDPNGFYEFLGDSSVPAFVDQVQTASVASAGTNWSANRTVPQFDPTLGTLISVQVTLSGSLTSQLRVENTSANPVTITATVQGDLTLSAPGASLTKQVKPLDNALFAADPFDGTIDFSGASGHDFGLQTASDSISTTLTTPVQLAPYQGVGNVALTGAAQNVQSVVTGGGGIASTLTSTAAATYTVTYHYAPFNCLNAGSYTIKQLVQPGGYADGFDTAGNVSAIPGSNTTDVIPVTLAGVGLTENNFGEIVPNCLVNPDCNDGNVCTTDTCDLVNNMCVYTPNVGPCSDGSACTTGDTCSGGICNGTPIVCDDTEPCNGVETCNPLSGCQAGPPLVCDDANACNGLETCVVNVGCVSGKGPFLLESKASIGNVCIIGGNMGVNAANGKIRLGRGSFMADMATLTASKITVAQAASAWRVEYNTLRLSQSSIVRNSSGPAVLPIQNPLCPIPEPFTCGGTDVVAGIGGSVNVTPGSYKGLLALNESTINIAPGNYVFCSVRTARAVTIVVNGPGATTIDVVGNVTFGNLNIVQLAGGAPPPTVRVSGKRVKVSTDSDVSLQVFAPHAAIAFGHNAKYTGSFCAAKTKVSNGSELACN